MAIRDCSHLTSRTYVSQRLRLHYVDWGNPDAPPLLLLHGGRDHCRNWDWVAQELRSDFHIIAPDLRGHGDSQWSPDGSYSAAAHWLSPWRSEEHTSELQSLMRISYAVFCLKKTNSINISTLLPLTSNHKLSE